MKERFIFNTVGLSTRDNKATVDFYTKTFGFTTAESWGQVLILSNKKVLRSEASKLEYTKGTVLFVYSPVPDVLSTEFMSSRSVILWVWV